jgi:hypothetical protein
MTRTPTSTAATTTTTTLKFYDDEDRLSQSGKKDC